MIQNLDSKYWDYQTAYVSRPSTAITFWPNSFRTPHCLILGQCKITELAIMVLPRGRKSTTHLRLTVLLFYYLSPPLWACIVYYSKLGHFFYLKGFVTFQMCPGDCTNSGTNRDQENKIKGPTFRKIAKKWPSGVVPFWKNPPPVPFHCKIGYNLI